MERHHEYFHFTCSKVSIKVYSVFKLKEGKTYHQLTRRWDGGQVKDLLCHHIMCRNVWK